jgi:phosphoribosylamine--glycine ligase
MRVLLLASTAREHAIADALNRSTSSPEIIAIATANNPGIRRLASELFVHDLCDAHFVREIAAKTKPDFAIIGPDDPIAAGIADALEEDGIPSVAPLRTLARIESSKGFTRDLLKKYNVAGAPMFKVFTWNRNDRNALQTIRTEMLAFIDGACHGNYVVKYDGLKGGKGVKLSGEHLRTLDEGLDYAVECLRECGRVVLEEKLEGVEFSFLSFVSGEKLVDMPAVQDHKRAFNGDIGPNTGGMGTYSDADHSLPFLTKADTQAASAINRAAIAALTRETGKSYRGILYGGYMATRDGVKLIEFNARFGDPEALNILALLRSDFVAICQAIIDGTLTEDLVQFDHKATVCTYIVPKGYPEKKDERGMSVTFPKSIPDNARIYYGDLSEKDDGTFLLGGSRSAGIVGIGDTIAQAQKVAAALCAHVEGPVRFRDDIGTDALVAKRIEMMKKIRG